MNIFVLDSDPEKAAQQHCDKHIPKMIVESAQMLSTAHRVLDGSEERRPSVSGKTRVKYWSLSDPKDEENLYKAVHVGHPCSIWTRESSANYQWHYEIFFFLCCEYEHRYNREHETARKLIDRLYVKPQNIPSGKRTPFRLAMGDQLECIDHQLPIESYRKFYQTKQSRFPMKWTNRKKPDWFRNQS
jgi:hypothetical protein